MAIDVCFLQDIVNSKSTFIIFISFNHVVSLFHKIIEANQYVFHFRAVWLNYVFLSPQNLLALGGEDKCITVSNVDGDTIRQVRVTP